MTNEEANILINKRLEVERMERGIVSWFNAEKGFGFIEREDAKGDIFVHFQDIQMKGYKTLEKGEHVVFDVEHSEKGDIARNVQVIDED